MVYWPRALKQKRRSTSLSCASLQHRRSIDSDGSSVRGNSKQFLISAHGENLHSAPSMRHCGRWTELKASQSRVRPNVVTSHVSGRTTARRDPNDCQRGRGCASRPTQGPRPLVQGIREPDLVWGIKHGWKVGNWREATLRLGPILSN